MQIDKMGQFGQILKSQIYDLSYHFDLWTVNKKSEEFVTLHSDFLEMSYEFNIKMNCLTPLLLGDVKNFLIPPRMADINIKLFKLTMTLELAGILYPQHSSSYAVRRRVECAGGNMRNASFKTYRHG